MYVAGFDLPVVVSQGVHADNTSLDGAEHEIAASLPAIPELAACLTQNERVVVLEATVARQFAEFVALHGDPFGCEMEVSQYVAVSDVIICVA